MRAYFEKLFKGRINVKNFILGISLIILLQIPLFIIMATAIKMNSTIQFIKQSWLGNFVVAVGIIILVCITAIFIFSLTVRRFHDMGLSLFTGADEWLFRDGDKQENKYGKPPEPKFDLKAIFGLSK